VKKNHQKKSYICFASDDVGIFVKKISEKKNHQKKVAKKNIRKKSYICFASDDVGIFVKKISEKKVTFALRLIMSEFL